MKYIESIIAVDAKAILFTRVPARDCRNSTRFSVILIHSLWTDVATFSILTLLKSFKKKKKYDDANSITRSYIFNNNIDVPRFLFTK